MKKTVPVFISYAFLAVYIGFIIFIRGQVPTPEVLLQSLQELYKAYGYPLIFVGALLEAMFLISFYVPGSTVVLFGAALARSGVVALPAVILIAVLGFLLGLGINYALGRFGWYLILSQFGLEKGIDVAKEKLQKNTIKAIFLGYFFPGSASFLSTAGGVLKMPFQKFLLLSLVAEVFWTTLWGVLAYFFGLPLVEFFIKYFTYIVFGIVAVWVVQKYVLKK